MIKHEFVFRDNIAIIRDIATGVEMIHQALRPTWGEPEPWTGEEQAREWAYHEFPGFFVDIPDPQDPTDPPIDDQSNTTPGA